MEVGFPHKTGNDFPGASPKIEQVARSIFPLLLFSTSATPQVLRHAWG